MSNMWLELPLPTEDDLAVPPVLYAAPATSLPYLEAYTRVTYGVPTVGWIIDEAHVLTAPRLIGGVEHYRVAPLMDHGAASARGLVDGDSYEVITTEMPTKDLWVYRPGPESMTLDDIQPASPTAWMERVLPDLLTPPPVRQPRPARELPSLTGKRVFVRGREGRWVPAIAVSEPFEGPHGVSVKLMRPEWYSLALYRTADYQDSMVSTMSLHRLWTY